MRTETLVKSKSDVPVNVSCPSLETKETVKSARKSLHPLQIAAGDKENFVGAGRVLPLSNENDPKAAVNSNALHISPKRDKKKSQGKKIFIKEDITSEGTSKNNTGEKKKITIKEEDLTSEEGPSDNYWQLLAETRRKALDDVLIENEKLRERLQNLEEENNQCKQLLDEAQGIIDTLNEIIAEVNNEPDNEVEDEIIRRP